MAGDDDVTASEPDEHEALATARDSLAKYLGYVLPEVAAINPVSALLLDQAIAGLKEQSADEPVIPRKYS
jgi:hypothetical protein